jgi:hypothetical protein
MGRLTTRYRAARLAVVPWAMFCLAAVAGCGSSVTLTPLEKGQALLKEGQWQAAVRSCDEALAENPDEPAAYLCRGKANLLLRHTDLAIADFTDAIRLAPRDPENLYQRAVAYKEAGKFKEAIADERQARKLDPEYMQVYLFQPEAYLPDRLKEVIPPDPDGHMAEAPDDTIDSHRERSGDLTRDPDSRVAKPKDKPKTITGEVDRLYTDRAKQKERELEAGRSTTVLDIYGQPIEIEPRTRTEEVLGLDLSKPGDVMPRRNGQSRDGSFMDESFSGGPARSGRDSSAFKTRSGTRPGNNSGGNIDRNNSDDVDAVPRLSQPISTAIGPPLQGYAPPTARGRGTQGDVAGSSGPFEPPINYPARSPYAGTGMRSTGLQQPDEAAPRYAAPFNAPGAMGPGIRGGGSNGAGGSAAGSGGYQRPVSPYSTPIQAGGRRTLTEDPGP